MPRRNQQPNRHQKSKLHQVLTAAGLTMRDFAPQVIGRDNKPLTVGTLRNIACGNSSSRLVRHRIQQLLETPIWDDIPFVPKAGFGLTTGDCLVFPTIGMAEEFMQGIDDSAERRGRYIRIVRPVKLTAKPADTASDDSPSGAFRDDDGTQEAIEIWGGEEPPGSPFGKDEKSRRHARGEKPNEL